MNTIGVMAHTEKNLFFFVENKNRETAQKQKTHILNKGGTIGNDGNDKKNESDENEDSEDEDDGNMAFGAVLNDDALLIEKTKGNMQNIVQKDENNKDENDKENDDENENEDSEFDDGDANPFAFGDSNTNNPSNKQKHGVNADSVHL